MIDTHCNDYDGYLADDDNDDKDDDKATMILGANDNDGRYRGDKSVTFFKQVSVKLEIRISEEPRGVQSPLGGRVGRGACERGWDGDWKALRMGGRREIK